MSPLVCAPSSSPSQAMFTQAPEWNVGQVVVFHFTSAWNFGASHSGAFWCSSSCSLSPISSLSVSSLSSSIFSSSRAALLSPAFHVPLLVHLHLQALLHAPHPNKRFTLLTIMSTTKTPSLSRSHITSLVILFSMYDPDASNTTLVPFPTMFETAIPHHLRDALLAFATWKVTFLNSAPSDVDTSSVFSPSLSTMLPSAVVWNTSRLDPSDSTVLWFGTTCSV